MAIKAYGARMACPSCGGSVNCKDHWLGWTEDGRTVIPNPALLEDGADRVIDDTRHRVMHTGVSARVYRRD